MMDKIQGIAKRKHAWAYLILLPLWTYGAFLLAQFILYYVFVGLKHVGVTFDQINAVVMATIISILAYILAIIIAILVPRRLVKQRTSLKDMGITGWLSWWDVLITPLAYVAYVVLSGVFIVIVANVVTIDVHQQQALPFSQSMLGAQWQYMLAFFTLVVLAPIAEELLFRGYLYGKLRKKISMWLSVLVASLTFGAAHLWAGQEGAALQWTVAADTFVLSLVMCVAREYTGAIWVPILMHIAKNGLAFYLLFVNPMFINQLKSAMLPLL